mgnify:CR=1 FL=1
MLRPKISRVIGGRRYSTHNAVCVADNAYWDGHNWHRGGYNTYLYRSPRGRYFSVQTSLWDGDRTRLEPLSEEEARQLYEELPEHNVPWEEAFPRVPVEDA